MGCASSAISVYDSEQEVIEMILKKPESSLTEDEKSKISEYLAKYEPVLTRLDKLMTDIKKRLNGEDDVPEYVATPADIAIGRLKSTMKTLKKEVTRLEKEEEHYKRLAIENKGSEEIYRMHLRNVARCRKAADVITNRMITIDEKLNDVQTAETTLSTLLSMSEIADNLESVQKAIGSVEDYQGVLDSMKDLDDTLQEMDMTLETGLADDDELEDYMNEVDDLIVQDLNLPEVPKTEVLPSVPTIQHTVEKKEERVAELEELYVC